MFNFLIDKKSLKVLLGINSIFILGANMFPPLFALFVKELKGGAFAAGSIWAVFAIVCGILTLILSRFGDRIKEKEYLVAAGYFLRLISWLGYFFADSLWHLYILQILLALGEALGTPAFNAIYSEHLDKGQYVKQWGVSSSSNAIVMGVSALLGGIIVSQFGFDSLFLTMSFLAAISLFLLIVQPRKLL